MSKAKKKAFKMIILGAVLIGIVLLIVSLRSGVSHDNYEQKIANILHEADVLPSDKGVIRMRQMLLEPGWGLTMWQCPENKTVINLPRNYHELRIHTYDTETAELINSCSQSTEPTSFRSGGSNVSCEIPDGCLEYEKYLHETTQDVSFSQAVKMILAEEGLIENQGSNIDLRQVLENLNEEKGIEVATTDPDSGYPVLGIGIRYNGEFPYTDRPIGHDNNAIVYRLDYQQRIDGCEKNSTYGQGYDRNEPHAKYLRCRRLLSDPLVSVSEVVESVERRYLTK